MCGRVIIPGKEEIQEVLQVSGPPVSSTVNVPPFGTQLPVIRSAGNYDLLNWPLLPAWSKTSKPDRSTINAKMERLTDPKSMWYRLKETQPAVVITQGFYEWQQVRPGDPKTPKIPYVIRTMEPLTLMAALWDRWLSADGKQEIFSTAMITMPGNELMEEIHNVPGDKFGRMPAFLTQETMGTWLDPELPYNERKQVLIKYPSEFLHAEAIRDVKDRLEVKNALVVSR